MNGQLQPEQVAAWLRERADFFISQPQLLSELRIPHDAGTVSLLEYQAQLLREENTKLRKQLEQLSQIARTNDRLFHSLRKLLLSLLAASTLDELLQAVRSGLLEEFQIPQVSVLLFSETKVTDRCKQLPLKQAKQAIGNLLKGGAQLCAALRDSELEFLFGEQAQAVCSAAIVPLGEKNHCHGLLALGSPDHERYRGAQGTLFLDYLGQILPCLLKRFLPPQQ